MIYNVAACTLITNSRFGFMPCTNSFAKNHVVTYSVTLLFGSLMCAFPKGQRDEDYALKPACVLRLAGRRGLRVLNDAH